MITLNFYVINVIQTNGIKQENMSMKSIPLLTHLLHTNEFMGVYLFFLNFDPNIDCGNVYPQSMF